MSIQISNSELRDLEARLDQIKRLPEMEQIDPLMNLSNAFANVGSMERAIDVARMIRDSAACGIALEYVSNVLIRKELPREALEVALMIDSDSPKGYALKYISEFFVKKKLLDRAVDVAWMMPNGYDSLTLRDISRIYAEQGNFTKAKDTADTIPHKNEKALARQRIRQTELSRTLYARTTN